MKRNAKAILAMVFAKHSNKAPDPSPEHEAKESPALEKAEHETGVELSDEDGIGPGAAADFHRKLADHFSGHAHPMPSGMDEKPKEGKGLGLEKLDLGMTDHAKAASHLRRLASHIERKAKK